ncbi:phosphate signaling complex protein PhoU [Paenibacillus massiliensis]|uniref:phosphate signaling complex protein PhoU n=1 Tax=Paenibacillus massiliensis TaxID=225917 RepID=UPI000415D019|nr:phosphate signaling complex protein PhoU [Paenibacillus massiliensis]
MIRRKDFDEGLEELRTLLLQMGGKVSEALDHAITALEKNDTELAHQVVNSDVQINQMEEQVLDMGSRLIVTQQPVAKDLRRIIVSFKISSDLERMGDLALDVAKVTLRLDGKQMLKPLAEIQEMAELVKTMTNEAISSYLNENTDQAYKMAQLDDKVDALYSRMISELYTFIGENPSQVSEAMLMLLVGRYIERIGDHATNIGESAVYLVTSQRPDLNQ